MSEELARATANIMNDIRELLRMQGITTVEEFNEQCDEITEIKYEFLHIIEEHLFDENGQIIT
jgi:hypothetical protein